VPRVCAEAVGSVRPWNWRPMKRARSVSALVTVAGDFAGGCVAAASTTLPQRCVQAESVPCHHPGGVATTSCCAEHSHFASHGEM